jgi:hypothetical protein
MAGERTCEVGSTLAPLATVKNNDVRFENFGKYIILCIEQDNIETT